MGYSFSIQGGFTLRKRLVLVGGGHVHLYIIKQIISKGLPGVEVVVISPSLYQYYSGMVSGFVEGIYELADLRIDVKALATLAKCTFIKHRVADVYPFKKVVRMENGSELKYDAISFDIGSLTAHTNIPGVKDFATSIKPNYFFPQVREIMHQAEEPVVVGGGIAGVEMALALQAWRINNNKRDPVTLLSSGTLLNNKKVKVRNKIRQLVNEKGIQIYENQRVEEITEQHIRTKIKLFDYDQVLWLTGPKASPLFDQAGLPTDEQGFLLVNSNLQVPDHPSIFGAGDCITIDNNLRLPKNGVYAIKQAPILWDNLKSFLNQQKLKPFKSQTHFLSILSTGNRKGFLMYGEFVASGSFAWYLKHKIDKNYINSFKKLLQD